MVPSSQVVMLPEEKPFLNGNVNHQSLNNLPEMIYQQNFKFIGDTWVRNILNYFLISKRFISLTKHAGWKQFSQKTNTIQVRI